MSYIETKSKFHVALDGQGLLLQGAPNAPAYSMKSAPVYGNRFASGDRSYNDLSQWWYLTQTDWSGGLKDFPSFEDDAKFYYSSNIDAWSELGKIKLARKNVAYKTFDQSICCGETILNLGNEKLTNRYYGEVLASAGKPKIYEELSSSPGTFTSLFGDIVYGNSIAVSHLFGNQGTIFSLLVGTDETGTVLIKAATAGIADVTANIDSVAGMNTNSARCGVSINETAYVFVDNNASTYAIVKTSEQYPNEDVNWTLVAKFLGSYRYPIAAVDFGGDILYLASSNNGAVLELRKYDLTSNIDILIRAFNNVTIPNLYGLGNLLRVYKGTAIITVPSEEIWSYDGSDLNRIYKKDTTKKTINAYVLPPNLSKGAIESNQMLWWGNLSYDGTTFFNTIRPSDEAINSYTYPLFTYVDDNMYFGESVEPKRVTKIEPAGTTYKTGASNTAFLVMSQHDNIQSIDKLLNSVTIGFDPMLSGQSINLYYRTSFTPEVEIANWTLLGSASYATDGGTVTSKILPFPVGVIAKKIWFRIELVGGGTNTPSFSDFTLEYLPIPNYKKEWKLNINCADEMQTLDGRLTEITARELKSRLEKMWWTKSALDFEDVDYATTLINNAAMAAADTTITVDSTTDFPEQGRLRVDNEEILYTGKTPTTFTGCTRGARGTLAATHADNAVINNAYKVLVTGVGESIPILLKDKHLEYITGLDLREV